MAMARMTNELRDTIRTAALAKAFAAEKAANEETLKILSRKIYDKLYSEDVQAAFAKMPDGFCDKAQSPTVSLAPAPNVSPSSLTLKFDKSVLWSVHCRYGNKMLVVDDGLYAEYRVYDDAVTDVEKKMTALKESLNQVLASANTVKKLIEIWPEGEKFIPDWAKNVVSSTMLPAVCVGNLNNLLAQALAA